MIQLDWVAKPFGPGDIAGDGTKKLLGTSVAPASLLLRETAQNSWDARRKGHVPEYQMRFRTLDERVMRILRQQVFTRTALGSELDKRLHAPSMQVIEIHDRGTTGLGGPTRNDKRAPRGETTNYRDFVLTVGAPRDQQYGAGTYGFGKTSAFRASRHETILVWTRIEPQPGQFQERFIAIAVNKSFEEGGVRYTGQQWWGRREEFNGMPRVEPVLDDDAHGLGESLFERRFTGDETGTSIMVLNPLFEDGNDDAMARVTFIEEIAKAATRNLWPKMIEGQAADRRMGISIVVDGRLQKLVGAAESEIVAAKERCLEAIRKLQAGEPNADLLVEDREIRCGRPKRLIGRLAMTALAVPPGDPFNEPGAVNVVTLMRSSAELVVEERDYPKTQNGRGEWVGVFKPELEMDEAFSASEPPTHDTWNPGALQGYKKTFVNMGLIRIKEAVQSFLAPEPDPEVVKDQSSAGELAAALSDLVAPAMEPENVVGGRGGKGRKRVKSKRGGTRTRSSKVEVKSHRLLPQRLGSDPNSEMTQFTLLARSDAKAVHVTPKLSVAVEGNQNIQDAEVFVDSWETSEGVSYSNDGIRVASGETFTVNICYPRDAAIECSFQGVDI
ncbi:hypothetical protein [Acidipropionibacterium virtanenii]|uniref:Uncharacterized protein n=1 Tax=Acidipropionibacterium virtanenii TaxID=2057246 RepID=A0A344URG7_9ACTN|nr:hypothetical protein [Acidipropionibacterium virtanenii]AXE37865.1 hypothetical protein JS278_00674 [Acidipropionibacterium virtanenii]